MGLIKKTTPLNARTEKDIFFSKPHYNPQFIYAEQIDKSLLTRYGIPSETLYSFAFKNLKNNVIPVIAEEDTITEEEIRQKVSNFNNMHNLEKPITLEFSPDIAGRCQILGSHLIVRSPIDISRDDFQGTIDHELNSHFLRSYNDKLQPWHDIAKRVDAQFRRTEEGLAQINGYLSREIQYSHKANLMYVAVYRAQFGSFLDVYNFLLDFDVTPDYAWSLTVRAKRGIDNTSLPGGLTKDITYLEGMIEVHNYLMDPSTDPHDLYLGKISIADISEKKHIANKIGLKYPQFIESVETYKSKVAEVGKANFFDRLLHA